MVTNLRYIAIAVLGLLAILFFVLSILFPFIYGTSGVTSKRGIIRATFFSILSFTSVTLALITYDTNMTPLAFVALCMMITVYCLLLVYHIGMQKISKMIGADEILKVLFEPFKKRQK